jgi:hypothetical protein
MKSQTPTWAIIVAILMMLIGGCGIKNDIQYINIRSMLAMKDKFMNKIDASIEKEKDSLAAVSPDAVAVDTLTMDTISEEAEDDFVNTDTSAIDINGEKKDINEVKDMIEGFLDVPEETIQWMIRLGYIGLFFSVLFLVGGLFLLIKKDFSIQLAYTVLGANIAFSIFKWIMLSGKGGSMLAISNSIGAAFSIIITIIVGIIIVSCDKSHYEESYTD